MKKKNIIITGSPRSGKSTLLEKVIQDIPQCHGILTREIRNNKNRVGFEMSNMLVRQSSDEPYCVKETIAHVNFETNKKVSRYYVDIKAIDTVLIGMEYSLSQPNFSTDTLLYVDEIGEMQLFSRNFKTMVKTFLDSEYNCLMTMTSVFESAFIDSIRKRNDVIILKLTEGNRIPIEVEIKKLLST